MPCRCGRAVWRAPRLFHGARPFTTSSAITSAEPWVERRPPHSAVQRWLGAARELQGRADQPLPHALTPTDFAHDQQQPAGGSSSPWYKPDASEQYVPLGEGPRPMGVALASTQPPSQDVVVRVAGQIPGQQQEIEMRSRRPERAADNPILGTLQGIAEGAGLTVLRLSDHHELLRQHSPHVRFSIDFLLVFG